MKQNILKYLFISLLLLSQASVNGQADTSRTARGGLIVGVDLSRFFVGFFEPVHNNFEFSLSYAIKDDIRLHAEGGYLNVDFDKDDYQYSLQGSYYRLGADLNALKRKPGELHEIYFGAAYAFSLYSHEASNITITDDYWGSGQGSLPVFNNNAHWLELKGGLRVEVLRNLFLGYAFRLRVMIKNNYDPLVEPYLVPGYGKADKNSAVGLSYSVFYRFGK